MTTRISKIARLPATVREQLNRRLHNGQLGRKILPWLNHLPETKEILADLFAGNPITHQNLSEWRRSGYQDWLFHQQRLDWFDRLDEEDAELNEHDGCADTYEAVSRHFVFEIGQALAALQKIKNPDDRWTRLQNLTREFSRLQNSYNWSRRVALEYDKYNGPEPEEPTEPEIEPENEALIETEEVPQLESPKNPLTVNEPTDTPALGAPASRWPDPTNHPESEITTPAFSATGTSALQDAPRSPEAEDQRASVLECGSPLPLSDVNSKTQTPFQPIPTPSPTTTPVMTYPSARNVPLSPRPSKAHTSPPPPMRGRRFTCVEG